MIRVLIILLLTLLWSVGPAPVHLHDAGITLPVLAPAAIESTPMRRSAQSLLNVLAGENIKPSTGTHVRDAASIMVDALRKYGPDANATTDQHGLTSQAQVTMRWDPVKGAGVPVSRPGAVPVAPQ